MLAFFARLAVDLLYAALDPRISAVETRRERDPAPAQERSLPAPAAQPR